ncbi:MAG: YIP1 family protein [Acidobacteriota bacterium]
MEESAFGRLIGAIVSPVKTFASIALRPTWLAPMAALVLAAVLVTLVVTPRMDMRSIIKQSIEESGRDLTPEQMDNAVEQGAKFAKIGPIVGIIAQPIVLLIIALVFWVGFKLAGGEFGFGTSFSVTTHAMLPGVLSALLSIPVVMNKPTLGYDEVKTGSFLMSNLGAFAPTGTHRALVSLLSSIDVFSIWTLILLVIGYRAAAKVSKGTAIGVVVGAWAVYVLCKVGFSAAFS